MKIIFLFFLTFFMLIPLYSMDYSPKATDYHNESSYTSNAENAEIFISSNFRRGDPSKPEEEAFQEELYNKRVLRRIMKRQTERASIALADGSVLLIKLYCIAAMCVASGVLIGTSLLYALFHNNF